MNILRKDFEAKLEDFDQKGIVTIYANAYDNVDADGDISAKGSFNKTVSENFNRIKHFLNHDSRLLVGIPLEIDTNDSFGLKIRSQLNMQKAIGRDTYEDYKLYKDHDRSLEHSFGYEVIKRDKSDKRIITEYKLWEYSTLTSWGANKNTPLIDMKNIKSTEEFIDLLVKMYNKPYSDLRLKQIETLLNSLENEDADPPLEGKGHSDVEEPNAEQELKAKEDAEMAILLEKLNLLQAKVQTK